MPKAGEDEWLKGLSLEKWLWAVGPVGLLTADGLGFPRALQSTL